MSLDFQFFPGRVDIGNVIISNGNDKADITELFKELNINIKVVLIFSLEDSFFPNSTVSPIKIIEANSKIIIPVEKRNVLDIYLYISEFKFIFKPL